jgi:hypothetical protein
MDRDAPLDSIDEESRPLPVIGVRRELVQSRAHDDDDDDVRRGPTPLCAPVTATVRGRRDRVCRERGEGVRAGWQDVRKTLACLHRRPATACGSRWRPIPRGCGDFAAFPAFALPPPPFLAVASAEMAQLALVRYPSRRLRSSAPGLAIGMEEAWTPPERARGRRQGVVVRLEIRRPKSLRHRHPARSHA